MAQDDFSPIYVGDTGAPFNPIFVHGDGSLVDLTGATITMKMVLQNNPASIQVCSGTWTIATPATSGQASYAYSAADVATTGIWELYITITINSKPIHADYKLLEILYAP